MMNRTAAIIFLNFIFIFMLTIIASMLKFNPTPLLSEVIVFKGISYDVGLWDKLLYLCLIFYGITIILSMVFLIHTAYRWNRLHFYDKTIFRNFTLLGILYTSIGVLTFVSSLNASFSQIQNIAKIRNVSLDSKHSVFIITIGLLFFLITAILKEAKRLKEETDLTI